MDQERFRRVMGHFATGVTVVTTRGPGGDPLGITVNAFTSVSLDPLLILVCLHRDSSVHGPILQAGSFAVNMLAASDGELAVRFARSDAPFRFDGVDYRPGPGGAPLLAGALAWLECRVAEIHPGGDHSIVIAEVLDGDAREGSPLLFFRGRLQEGGS